MTALEIAPSHPIIQQTLIRPLHTGLLVRIYLEKQLPVHCFLFERGGARIALVGDAMRNKLALRTHVVLERIGES